MNNAPLTDINLKKKRAILLMNRIDASITLVELTVFCKQLPEVESEIFQLNNKRAELSSQLLYSNI